MLKSSINAMSDRKKSESVRKPAATQEPAAPQEPAGPKKSRKSGYCGRCRVHGVDNLMGKELLHKRFCPFQDCTCADCDLYLRKARLSADQIARNRAKKAYSYRKLNPMEVKPSSVAHIERQKSDFHNLMKYTWSEIYKFSALLNFSKMYRIVNILNDYALNDDARIKLHGSLRLAKSRIDKVIHENEMQFMTWPQACCYVQQPWPVEYPNKEQSIGITSSQCLLQKLPAWEPSNPLPMSATCTATSTAYFESSFKPVEPFAEPFIDPSRETPIEPFIDPCTLSPEHSPESCIDLSTKSSTCFRSIAGSQ